MQRHIAIMVKNEIFCGKPVPRKSNRRFHPKKEDIRSHMYKATVKHRFAKIDQANLWCIIEKWKAEQPNDSFFYRSYGKDTKTGTGFTPPMVYDENGTRIDKSEQVKEKPKRLLFAHQTENQRRLIKLYGQKVCIIS